MNYGLHDKVALVTGAARDVGRQVALALAAEGAAIAVNFRASEAQALTQVIAAGACGTVSQNAGSWP